MTIKFDALQIENIIDKVVPLIASEEDQGFFRGVLFLKAESCNSSAAFAAFISTLLKGGDQI